MNFGDFFYNENQPFITRDIFFYDVKECYPRILEKVGIQVPAFSNKLERNMYIGREIFKDRNLLTLCQSFTKKIITNFVNLNNILIDDIIMVERDGLAIKKFIEKDNLEFQPELREKFDVIIRSYTRKQAYMMFVDNKVIIKGIPQKTIGLEEFVGKYSKKILTLKLNVISKTLNIMRKDYFNCDNWKLFAIPQDDESYLFILNTDKIKIKQPDKINFKTMDINRSFYFKNHLEGFYQGLMMETI
jgi:hypothetical protein